MEQKVILTGIELIDFENDKGERVKLTKLHLLDPESAAEATNMFMGRRVATLCTAKIDQKWYEMLGREVFIVYTLRLGAKKPTFNSMRLAQASK